MTHKDLGKSEDKKIKYEELKTALGILCQLDAAVGLCFLLLRNLIQKARNEGQICM